MMRYIKSTPAEYFHFSSGTICFGLAISFLPMLLLNPRKFSLLFTLGSVFTLSRYQLIVLVIRSDYNEILCSFSFLWGPYSHMVHLFSKERLPFTLVYLTTLIGKIKCQNDLYLYPYFPKATLYFAMGLQSAILTPIAAVLQVFDDNIY